MLRRLIGRRARRTPEAPWVVVEDEPPRCEPLAAFRLFAIVATWMEADVVQATVKNALTQGCERVYLVDNDSPDDTVAEARAAGAILARSFTTESYDETLRLRIMNEVVAEVSAGERDAHVWWLWLDADEFHHGPRGLTLRAYLAGLDRRFRVVGARVFNHFPDRKPEYVSGRHPLEFQPLCEEFTVGHCPAGHWKHPLQRFDRGGPVLASGIGFHKIESPGVPLREPATPVFMHHFQYRDETVTRRRLERLCLHTGGAPAARIALTDARWNGSGISKRFRTLAAVYARHWDEVANLRRVDPAIGVAPVPWTTLVRPEDTAYRVWYPDPAPPAPGS